MPKDKILAAVVAGWVYFSGQTSLPSGTARRSGAISAIRMGNMRWQMVARFT
ncbi:hypothetical protein [Mesorhizobium sp.]|uniref:hypothetical protein n=1 Tax=Mesorhizobium sp. TaxID=1871066 RepID=UPI0025C174E4|nr:hypothetical protein [Mesorhizobium sp.]